MKELKKDYGLYKELIRDLQTMLQKENMYVQNFKQAHEHLKEKNVENLKIVFHTKEKLNGSHRKVYDAPTVHEVAAILPEDDTTSWNSRCVIVYLRDTTTRRENMK